MKNLLFILLALIVFSCKQKGPTDEAIININKIPKDGVVLNRWQILGPFPSNGQDQYFDVDNLEIFGLKEQDVTFANFLNLSKKTARDTSSLDSNFCNTYIFSDNKPLDFLEIKKPPMENFEGSMYCACLIKSKKDISTRLHFSTGQKAKIWLNNELICFADYSLPSASYREYIPVNLKKGDNTLLIKLNKPNKYLEMYARLENTSETGIKRHFELHNHFIVDGSVLVWPDSIRLDRLFLKCDGKITITDNDKNVMIEDSVYGNKRWAKCISSFKKGLYHAKFEVGDMALQQDFYAGNIVDSIQQISIELQSMKTNGKIKNNIDALIFRFEHLQKNTYIGDKKYVPLFVQLNKAYNYIKAGKNPYHHTSGLFIRSYISDIDSSKQYYLLHVPSTYKKDAPMPCIIVTPAMIGKLPYLKSFRVANTKLIELLQDLAEKHNMIVIEQGSRRFFYSNSNTIDESDFFDIMRDVKADYNIDEDRRYVTGSCSGSNDGLKLAVKYPDFFAAIGFISPEIVFSTYKETPWTIQQLTPVTLLSNIKDIPFIDIHSLIDRHVSVEHSNALSKFAQHKGMEHFVYKQLPNEFPMYYADEFFDDVFDFCKKHTLNPHPEEVDFSTYNILYNKSFWVSLDEIVPEKKAHIHAKLKGNRLDITKENIVAYTIDLSGMPYNKNKKLKITDNGEVVYNGITSGIAVHVGNPINPGKITKNSKIAGPFAHIFANRFIIVKGTTGSKPENEKISSLADTINKYWYDRYFTTCKVKNDFEINEKDIEESSLLLLGNYTSNRILKTLEGKIPLQIADTLIQIKDNRAKKENLCFYLIYPNPLNKDKYVAVIGYNNPAHVSLGAEYATTFDDVSNYGWFDYKVWEAKYPADSLMSGYFNHRWE
jgi:hypothetical protein